MASASAASTPPAVTSAAAAVAAPAPAPDVRAGRAVKVTVSDADVLECGLCLLPLRRPIFQCKDGHVVCSACRDKMEAAGNGNCHICRVATRGYGRCHAMEQLLDCIHVPCPYFSHGCDATLPYHGQESHSQVCPHAPYHCPGESCGFVSSPDGLLDHFVDKHDWPCWDKCKAGERHNIRLQHGFNFLLLDDHDGDQSAGVRPCRLFLLNVTQQRLGRAISVLCIHPHASANGAQQQPSMQCELVFSRKGDGILRSHKQSSVFEVVCTDLSNGLPNPEGCFHFFVDNAVGDGNDILVSARIIC